MNDKGMGNVEKLDAVALQTVAIESHDRLVLVARALADLLQAEGMDRETASVLGGAVGVISDVLEDLDAAAG